MTCFDTKMMVDNQVKLIFNFSYVLTDILSFLIKNEIDEQPH